MRQIPLHNSNKFALVDDNQYTKARKLKWNLSKGHAKSTTRIDGCFQVYLHIFLFGYSQTGNGWDHENGNGLDCQFYNLRPASKSQNGCNRGRQTNNSSGFKGVVFRPTYKKKWEAQIQLEGKNYHAGRFSNPIDAAIAYDKAARRLHGSFARINFPIGSGSSRELPARSF